jgi:hypothetical protein
MNAQQPFETFLTIHQSTWLEHLGRPDYLIEKYPKNMILYCPSTALVACSYVRRPLCTTVGSKVCHYNSSFCKQYIGQGTIFNMRERCNSCSVQVRSAFLRFVNQALYCSGQYSLSAKNTAQQNVFHM